jgi:dTDP-4-amino-4,6-dideoxygalactose transaminase
MTPHKIPFNKPFLNGNELLYIADAHARCQLAGDGFYTKSCSDWLETTTGAQKVLLTHSCTAALEMSALLADIKPGDEILMPSFTFVSTANAFVLRGAVAVFVDIREDTLNIDETKIEELITSKTRAIVPVHYAGVSCEMDKIVEISKRYNLIVIEDAAQGMMATYKGRALGSIGHMGALSFHETKNVISGEGGALMMGDASLISRAEIIREKGTNRSNFARGLIDKYTWVDIGSSFLPGELTAAFLFAQLEDARRITNIRLQLWHKYHSAFAHLEYKGIVRRPSIPSNCEHNAHMYYLILRNKQTRTIFIEYMNQRGVNCVFHYVPLHNSPAGLKFGRVDAEMTNTLALSERIVRLPLYPGLEDQVHTVIDLVHDFFLRK